MEKSGTIGIQMSMLKDAVEKLGVYETMRRCAEIGYHCVEISQVPITPENIYEFQHAQGDFGIRVAAMSAKREPTKTDLGLDESYDTIVANCRALKCDILRIGCGPIYTMSRAEDIVQYARAAEEDARRLEADGISYYYHNHAYEFVKFNGKYVLDILRENSSKLGFELDTHWIHVGGEDPVRVIERFAERIRLLHLKDYRIALPGHDVSLCKDGAPIINPQYLGIQFSEIGEGSLDIKGCITAGAVGGSEYFLIEQDSTYGRDPFESLRISKENLEAMGFGEWF